MPRHDDEPRPSTYATVNFYGFVFVQHMQCDAWVLSVRRLHRMPRQFQHSHKQHCIRGMGSYGGQHMRLGIICWGSVWLMHWVITIWKNPPMSKRIEIRVVRVYAASLLRPKMEGGAMETAACVVSSQLRPSWWYHTAVQCRRPPEHLQDLE